MRALALVSAFAGSCVLSHPGHAGPRGVTFHAPPVAPHAHDQSTRGSAAAPLAVPAPVASYPLPDAAVRLRQQPAVPLTAQPFSLSNVALTPGSRFQVARAANADFLFALDNARLTCLYTLPANISNGCVPYDHPAYQGHYLGHWLSATAQLYAATGNASIQAKAAAVVATLAQVQQLWGAAGEPGFLFSWTPASFAALEQNPPSNCDPVCVPFYVMHKMLAGMLDQYTLAGNAQALQVAIAMGHWVKSNVEGVLASGGQTLWQAVLTIEWGGMNDGLYRLYDVTGDADFLTTAYYFNHWAWTVPLIDNVDALSGQHANTHIPEVIGDSYGWLLTGNATQAAIVQNFLAILNASHTFATGGSNDFEHWGDPLALADQLNDQTEESCTTYNLLKAIRNVWTVTGSAALADWYERALFNGLMGNQWLGAPFNSTPDTTGFIYMLPLGPSVQKAWGASTAGFPCCWGTLSETFAKLSDSIWFEGVNTTTPTVYVNLFVPSTLTWEATGVTLTQAGGFPESTTVTTAVSVQMASPSAVFAMAVRVPYWATGAINITVNGQPWGGAPPAPSSYVVITREWLNGDLVTVWYEPQLRFEQIEDNRAAFQGLGAIMYGGVLLAGLTSHSQQPDTTPATLLASINRTSATDLVFAMPDECGAATTLLPLMDIGLQTYTVYFQTGAAQVVGYNASGVSFLPTDASSWLVSGGAGIVANGATQNIRSGDPDEVDTVANAAIVQDDTHLVTGFAFSYQYVSGYGPAGKHVGANFTAVVMDQCSQAVLATLYQSPELTEYPFDVCSTCYSPWQNVTVTGLALNVSSPVRVALVFNDNDRNLQLNLPFPMTIQW